VSSERDWLRSANHAPAWTTHRGKVTREDLFNEIDILKARVAEKDGMLDSGIRASLTRIRSLAATLCPKPALFTCDFEYESGFVCGIRCSSRLALDAHRELVHEVSSDADARFGHAERVGRPPNGG
jgi:hypothetical protein